ncbi:5-methylcytosine restriction system specificity protein McrC [Natronococcus jeotgali]|uniref:McrBC 5-methylcytosine restriction system component-like protein n=1 Tax=Natronococcus jeotgali DSM 18795 TaxID=1227498 RepID=L9X9X8_9EURY|nr:hypothetical protein [Natronococcus jeotgali]ELY58495.1 hypothetical protein C492_11790 [Natronococcus jeotgali DSM 18795]
MSATQLPSQVSIREHGERSIKCPPGIEEQLEKAAFEQESANVFVKRRRSVEDNTEYKVVEARIEGDELTLSVEDIVGIVNLTPTSRLQIEPKIGWSEILDMFLTVQRYNRSLDYHGIPIKDFLSEDIQLEDIFIVIAVNYLNSLEPLQRHGFIRQFQTKRVDAIDSRGRIDVERSLLNIETGVPKQHYVQKVIDYNTPINALIHCAGKQLLQLFQTRSDQHTQEEYYRIFSDLHNAVNELESMGINGNTGNPAVYREITSDQLPRQRGYYNRIVDVSKMILSSTTGQSLESGDEELTMDYLFDMENLFEEFTQIVLEEEIHDLRSNPLYSGLDDVRVKSKDVIYPYEDTNQARHQPDHVLYKGNSPIAVLDSKYYEKDRDPSMIRPIRSQMFSYAFLLDVDQMALLCPEGHQNVRSLRGRSGEISVVSSDRTFTTDRYRKAIREYLLTVLDDAFVESQVVADIRDETICHADIETNSVEEVLESDTLALDNVVGLSRSIFNQAVSESRKIRALRELDRGPRRNIQIGLREKLEEFEEFDRCIPIFIDRAETIVGSDLERGNEVPEDEESEWDGEILRLHFVKTGKTELIKTIETIDCFPLDWEGDLD